MDVTDSAPEPLVRDDGFVARGATLDDAPAIARVVAAAFPEWPSVAIDVPLLDHLVWKMTSPGIPPFHHTVVTDEGAVVASKLRWVALANLDGRPITVDSGADFAVDPAYQGRGVGRFLNEYEGTGRRVRGDIALDLVPSNAVVRERMHSDVRIPKPLQVWRLPLRLRTAVAVNVAARHRASRPIEVLRQALRRRGGRTTEVIALDGFDDRTDRLWEAAASQFHFARSRAAEYLNWRYSDPRSGRITLLAVPDREELAALAVVRASGQSASLLDLVVRPDQRGAGTRLLRHAATLSRRRGAAALTAWLPPGHPHRLLLRDAGFTELRESVAGEFFQPRGGVTTQALLDRLADPALRMHITMGDFDFA